MGSFQPHCNVPPPDANFVFGPQIRGTPDIVWTSVSILLLCTWSIQHPNVPFPMSSNGSFSGLLLGFFQGLEKIGSTLVTLYAPEMYFGKALTELMSCWYGRMEIGEMATRDGVQWSLTHSFFAHMGGFMIRFDQLDHQRAGQEATEAAELKDSMILPKFEGIHAAQIKASSSVGDQQSDELQKDQEIRPGLPPPSAPTTNTVDKNESDTLEAQPIPENQEGRDIEQNHQGTRLKGSIAQKIYQCQVPRSVNFDMDEYIIRPTIDFMSNDGTYGVDPTERKMHETDRMFGSSDWRVSPQNHKVVWEALRSVSWATLRKAGIQRVSDVPIWHCTVANLQGNVWVIDFNQLMEARRRGILSRLPAVSEEHLKNQSKMDVVSKAIAIYQVIWLVVQLANRWRMGMAVAQLEILALAFAVCSVLTYAVLWRKPQGVSEPVFTLAARHPTAEDIIALAAKGRRGMNLEPTPRGLFPDSIPRIFAGGQEIWTGLVGMAFFGISAVFGAVHCVAWNFQFPTLVEQKMWQASSLVTILAPAVLLLTADTVRASLVVAGLNRRNLGIGPWLWNQVRIGIFLLAVMLYFWSRFYMVVEVFRSLFYLPPSTYQTSDVVNMPHW